LSRSYKKKTNLYTVTSSGGMMWRPTSPACSRKRLSMFLQGPQGPKAISEARVQSSDHSDLSFLGCWQVCHKWISSPTHITIILEGQGKIEWKVDSEKGQDRKHKLEHWDTTPLNRGFDDELLPRRGIINSKWLWRDDAYHPYGQHEA
jgi:hypothetical protein